MSRGGEWRTARLGLAPCAPSRTLPRFAGEGGLGVAANVWVRQGVRNEPRASGAAPEDLSAALRAGVILRVQDPLSREAGEGTGGGRASDSA
jgi:hypothetical protein